jgi:hypothetical protein
MPSEISVSALLKVLAGSLVSWTLSLKVVGEVDELLPHQIMGVRSMGIDYRLFCLTFQYC